MSSSSMTTVLDVRLMPPRERHPRIFQLWSELPDGGALRLVNDHDPLPLYYQFSAEHPGEFSWQYLEEGPVRWSVRIGRGHFPDPGFHPRRQSTHRAVP